MDYIRSLLIAQSNVLEARQWITLAKDRVIEERELIELDQTQMMINATKEHELEEIANDLLKMSKTLSDLI